MYMAIIEGYNDIFSFNTDKEKAKKQAVKKAKDLYQDEINAPFGLPSWTWENIQEYFGAYIIDIKDNSVMTTERIKAGYCDKFISYN